MNVNLMIPMGEVISYDVFRQFTFVVVDVSLSRQISDLTELPKLSSSTLLPSPRSPLEKSG
jgi:hypothetical protein